MIRTAIHAGVGIFSLTMLATSLLPLWSDTLSSAEAQDLQEQQAQTHDVSSANFRAIEISIPMDDHNMKAAGISTIHVVPDDGKAELTFPGTVVVPQQQLRMVAAPAGGLVEKMLVAQDEAVTAGQPVAQVRSPDMVEAQRQYLAAMSDETLAADKLRRAKLLVEGKALPEKDLRIAESEAAIAKSRLDERKQILFLMGMDQADFDSLTTNRGIVSLLVVKSPINGTVVTRHASTGEQVKAATPLYTIGALDPLWVNIQVPSHRLSNLSVGERVTLPAYGIEGEIIRIGRTIDQSTQSTIAVAEIPAAGGRLRPGLAVATSVRVESAQAAATGKSWSVPSTSIVRHRDQTWVFTKSTDGFRARPVQVISESAKSVAVRADFRPSDQIASRGVLALLSELVDADKEE
ncbi:MAG: efflux RND transporter periplasmic adaptor subunit [Afipia sp.]|nr:efflux RND transporter periplasmic adaptor subunit [Afipia sp.]